MYLRVLPSKFQDFRDHTFKTISTQKKMINILKSLFSQISTYQALTGLFSGAWSHSFCAAAWASNGMMVWCSGVNILSKLVCAINHLQTLCRYGSSGIHIVFNSLLHSTTSNYTCSTRQAKYRIFHDDSISSVEFIYLNKEKSQSYLKESIYTNPSIIHRWSWEHCHVLQSYTKILMQVLPFNKAYHVRLLHKSSLYLPFENSQAEFHYMRTENLISKAAYIWNWFADNRVRGP